MGFGTKSFGTGVFGVERSLVKPLAGSPQPVVVPSRVLFPPRENRKLKVRGR